MADSTSEARDSVEAVLQASGRTIVGAVLENGWPVILLNNGSRLLLMDAEGVVAPCVEYQPPPTPGG